ncbi:MAG TPA: beta-ketoacyl synthase chain length factor [Anaeromyxobacteraceae bacterium]|nr:beta-ketoacyl synthase chain length factor [Anaeromyxobacteraceae bacterium]
MISLHVNGIGFWSPGYGDVNAWRAAAPDPAVRAPAAALIPSALRRRVTTLTLLAAEVAAQASAGAAADLTTAAFVLGSAYGEIGCAVEMMRSFGESEGMPSPTRFHNSVHNTPAAYVSIATGNRGFSTAIAAGAETTAAALIEAATVLADRGGDAVVVLLDEPVPGPFTRSPGAPLAAAALALSAAPRAATLARVGALRRGRGLAPELAGGLASHPCAGAFALVDAISRRVSGPVALGPFEGEGWIAELEAGGGR